MNRKAVNKLIAAVADLERAYEGDVDAMLTERKERKAIAAVRDLGPEFWREAANLAQTDPCVRGALAELAKAMLIARETEEEAFRRVMEEAPVR